MYDDFGLMRERAVYAHRIHFDDDDRAPDARHRRQWPPSARRATFFLGSGFFDYASADRVGFRYGLASDVGGAPASAPSIR